MDKSKMAIGEELIALSKLIYAESTSVKRDAEDDDYDAGYKNGLKEGFYKVSELINARLDILLVESKSGESNG